MACIFLAHAVRVHETGFSADCNVYTGIHDSIATFALYPRGHRQPFSLVSIGMWIVVMSLRMAMDRLGSAREAVAIVDVDGSPVHTARYLGAAVSNCSTGQGAG